MLIPKSFRIGRKKYKVDIQDNSLKRFGSFMPEANRVTIYRAWKFKERTEAAMAETFWHEVTHAILHDIDHPRWKDEAFVLAFSKRLTEVVRTAELEA